MFFKWLLTLVLLALPTFAAPSPLVSVKKTKNAVPGRYIVTFKDDGGSFPGVSSIADNFSPDSKVTHKWDVIGGFAGTLTDSDIEFLKSHPNVVSIEEDGYAHTQAVVTQ